MKQCKGKYHGKVIKYIKDDEKFCSICLGRKKYITKQKLKKIGEVAAGIAITTVALVGSVSKINNDDSES